MTQWQRMNRQGRVNRQGRINWWRRMKRGSA
jgi:hypothetical protein